MWYEKELKPLVPVRVARCPVCKTRFGFVQQGGFAKFHCDDCRASYEFEPGMKQPKAVLDTIDHTCHCVGCQGRDEKEAEINPVLSECDSDDCYPHE